MSILSSVASIGAGLLGGIMDNNNSKASAKQQYKYNKELQEDNQAFQIEMAKNAHQYEMEDLKNAGINPILTAGGSSAGAIAGSSAPQGTSPGQNYDNFSRAFGNAITAMQTNSAMKLNDSQINLNNATATKTLNESDVIKPTAKAKIRNLTSATAVNKAEAELKKSQKALTQQQTRTERENTTKTHYEAFESIHRSQKYDSERDYNKRRASGKSVSLSYQGKSKNSARKISGGITY